MEREWYTRISPITEDRHYEMTDALLASGEVRRLTPNPLRTTGAPLLILAAIENWPLKTDNFCLMANVSRPTGRKLIRTYLEFGIARQDHEGNLGASPALLDVAQQRAKPLALNLWGSHDHPKITQAMHALCRFDQAGLSGLTPVSSSHALALLMIDRPSRGRPRRTRNILQQYLDMTGEDLEPHLRRWMLNHWIDASDDHFFNDRFLVTTELGRCISRDLTALLDHCLTLASGYSR